MKECKCDQNKRRFISKGFIYDTCYILIKNGKGEYFDINKMKITTKELQDAIMKDILSKHYEADKGYVRNKKCKTFWDVMELEKYNNYDRTVTDNICKELKRNNKYNKTFINLLTDNAEIKWKRKDSLIIDKCPVCQTKWMSPLDHIIKDCEKIKKQVKMISDQLQSKWNELENITQIENR